LTGGGRKVSAWQKCQKYTEVDFSGLNLNSMADGFINLNTFEDLAALELQLSN
jgi:molybdopterin-guanine dinucleotide biosynthesis protein A